MKVFDLRFPLGYLFATLGVLLIIADMLAGPNANAPSLGIDIHRIWGGVMIGFGILSLVLAWRERRRRRALVSERQK
jgi:hypothetical protein